MEETAVNDNGIDSPENMNDAVEADSADDAGLYLTFTLGGDIFGIRVNEVREVIEYRQVFKIPRVPDYIRGVINLRGEVVPVVDLYSRFYKRANDKSKSSSIVIVELNDEGARTPIGVMIDSVNEVIEIGERDIESVPEIGSRIRGDFIEGIGKPDERFVILLNVHRVLDIEELSDIDDIIN